MRLVALAAALLAAPGAHAGLRATYAIAGEAKPLVVEVADNGDASFTMGKGKLRVTVIDGHAFAIQAGEGGGEVVRFADVTRLIGSEAARQGKPARGLLAPLRLETRRAGQRTVAGVKGSRYRVRSPDGTREDAAEIVVTDAAALRPIGAAVAVLAAEGDGIVALLDWAMPELARWMQSLATLAPLGTPLRWEGRYALLAVEEMAIAPETIALPAPPITPDRLMALVRDGSVVP